MAYRGSKFLKKYSFYSWTVHTVRIFGKNFICRNGGRFTKKGGFSPNFQSSISPLSLMIELRLSLQTYRNSYFVYPKKVFSMTLNFRVKVKWHMCLALPYFRQKGQQGCHQIPSKLPRRQIILANIVP